MLFFGVMTSLLFTYLVILLQRVYSASPTTSIASILVFFATISAALLVVPSATTGAAVGATVGVVMVIVVVGVVVFALTKST